MTLASSAMPKGLLVDLDDTLYDYVPAHHAGLDAVLPLISASMVIAPEEIKRALDAAKADVKARLGATGSSHSRLLYFAELVHRVGRVDRLGDVRTWERAYWNGFLSRATLREGARELFASFRARGGKIAIVTDLTLEVQLWKLERFDLLSCIDALCASEEVREDKPHAALFELAIARLSLPRSACVMVGDSKKKDGAGAHALGIPFYLVASSERPSDGGDSLVAIAKKLEEGSEGTS